VWTHLVWCILHTTMTRAGQKHVLNLTSCRQRPSTQSETQQLIEKVDQLDANPWPSPFHNLRTKLRQVEVEKIQEWLQHYINQSLWKLFPLCQMDSGTAHTSLVSPFTHTMWCLPLTGAKQERMGSTESNKIKNSLPKKMCIKGPLSTLSSRLHCLKRNIRKLSLGRYNFKRYLLVSSNTLILSSGHSDPNPKLSF